MILLVTSVAVLGFFTWFTRINVPFVAVTTVTSMVTKFTINIDLMVNVFSFVSKRTNNAVVTLVTFGPRSLWLLERSKRIAFCGRFLSCYQQFYPAFTETF